eukprot:gene65156-89139_t
MPGFRLRFKSSVTFVTQTGGTYGCLTLASSGQDIATELINLASIDVVTVSKSVPNNNTVVYTITFVGDLVRGNVPLIEVLDLGSNGCKSTPIVSSLSSNVQTIRKSVVPIYRLETTNALPFDSTVVQVKDALQSLNS